MRSYGEDRCSFAGLAVKRAIRGLLSRPLTQRTLLGLLKICHAGLNYGGGQSVGESGEIEALEFVRDARGNAEPFTLFDVGANDGSYLQIALRVLDGNLKAFSFEPQAASFQQLQVRFGGTPRLELRKAALGSEPGTMELVYGCDGDTAASLHRESVLGQTRSEQVPVTTVDQMCEAEKIEMIDLLKIDTEGHEMGVLLGASNMITSGRIAAIQFEFGDTFLRTPYHFTDLWALLSPRYRFYRILRHGLTEVSRYSSDLEIYKIANFLCMLKA
jgi:FkbM family methyltransferase